MRSLIEYEGGKWLKDGWHDVTVTGFEGIENPKTNNVGVSFELEDEGIWLHTDAGKIPVHFDAERYRPLEVPILLGDTTKIDQLGFQIRYTVGDIVRDQINHYRNGSSAANTLAALGSASD